MSEMSGFVSGGVPDCPVDRESVRANILRLESASRDLPQVDCPLKHHFAPGLYAREIFIPAGSVVVGKIHRHSHINVISQGSAIVVTEFGRMEVSAPYTFVSEPEPSDPLSPPPILCGPRFTRTSLTPPTLKPLRLKSSPHPMRPSGLIRRPWSASNEFCSNRYWHPSGNGSFGG